MQGYILKEIIDVAIDDLIARDPNVSVSPVRDLLTCKKFYIAIMNWHSKSFWLIGRHIGKKGTFMREGDPRLGLGSVA